MKKVLHLTLKKHWFGLIASGLKGYELREDKPYWRSRLTDPDGGLRDFDEIHFTLGYGRECSFMRVAFLVMYRLTVDEVRRFAVHGEDVSSGQFVICLGPVLEVLRYPAVVSSSPVEYEIGGRWKDGEFADMRSGSDRRRGNDRRVNPDRRKNKDRRAG